MEELTLILSTIKELAAMGSQVGIWWIILFYTMKFIQMFLISGTIIWVVTIVFRCIEKCNLH